MPGPGLDKFGAKLDVDERVFDVGAHKASYTSEKYKGVKGLSDDELKASKARKIYLFCVMLFFHIFPFVMAKRDIQFLDDWRANIPNIQLFDDFCRLKWNTFINSYSRFAVCMFVSALVHSVTYFAFSLPGFIYQFLPFMEKYKIQKNAKASPKMQWNCFAYVLYSQIVVQLPFFAGVYFTAKFLNLQFEYDSMMKWYQMAFSILGSSAIEDTWHFFVHWLAHHKKLYKHVHKIHHEHTYPFSITAEYAHPAEQLILGSGFAIGLALYGIHIIDAWLWMAFRLLEACEVHQGYEVMLYINPFRFIPWYAGAEFHDFHHENFIGNYASFYIWWDEIFDTNLMHKRKHRLDSLVKAKSA